MTDQKTEAEIAAEKEAADKAAADKAAADAAASGGERRVPESALKIQAADFQKQIAERDKKIAARDAADLKAKEDKLLADGETKKLLELREKDNAEKDKVIADLKRSQLSDKAWKVLHGLGMIDPDRLELYSTSKLPQDATEESIEEWAKLLKADSPEKFTAPVKPVGQSSVGSPAIGATDGSLKSRLESDDKEVKLAALKEELVGTLSGELSPNREDRK